MTGPKVKGPRDKPSGHRSVEHLEALAAVQQERQEDALSPHHSPKPNFGFKYQPLIWNAASEEERHALVYGMVFYDGAIAKGMTDISRFFGLPKEKLQPYKETFEMAKVALKLKLQRNTINLGLQREDAIVLKFHLLKQYAEQVENPAHEGKESLDESKAVEIKLNVVRNNNEEVNDLRSELDAMVAAADNKLQ
jgi:hypothetical protein